MDILKIHLKERGELYESSTASFQERAGTATSFLTNWRKGIPMTKYKVITLPLAEEDIADQTDYIAFELKSPAF